MRTEVFSLSAVIDIREKELILQAEPEKERVLSFAECAREFARRVKNEPADYRDRMPDIRQENSRDGFLVAFGRLNERDLVFVGEADTISQPPYLLFYTADGIVRLEARQPHRPYDLFLPDPLERCRGKFEEIQRAIAARGFGFYEI